MKNKLLIPLVALLALVGFVSALAQSQSPTSQPQMPTYQPGAPLLETQGIRGYRLGPGDVLDVRVWGQPDLYSTPEIDEEGNISSLPFVEEPIPAKCRTEFDVQKSITEAYAKYLVKPRVSVKIAERKSRAPVTVYGAVYAPKQIATIRRLQLHEVIASSGGFTANAGAVIQVIHTQPEMCPEPGPETSTNQTVSDIGKITQYKINDLRAGIDAGDPFIRPGDIVFVAEGEPVYITGLVYSPSTLIIKEQITLLRAVGMAGGLQRLANAKEVHILRQRSGNVSPDDIKVNFEAIRKGQEPDVALQAYDVVDVREVGIFSSKKLADIFAGLPMTAVTKVPVR